LWLLPQWTNLDRTARLRRRQGTAWPSSNLDRVKLRALGVKHLLADLDEALRKQGDDRRVLIAAARRSFRSIYLPNPVDDEDKDVPSVNPYGSIDENYFVHLRLVAYLMARL